jgi:hypothetical protein
VDHGCRWTGEAARGGDQANFEKTTQIQVIEPGHCYRGSIGAELGRLVAGRSHFGGPVFSDRWSVVRWHGDRGVAGAGNDGEAGIFGEGGVGRGEVTKEKEGAAVGLDFARVQAVGAEADGSGARFSRWTHGLSSPMTLPNVLARHTHSAWSCTSQSGLRTNVRGHGPEGSSISRYQVCTRPQDVFSNFH